MPHWTDRLPSRPTVQIFQFVAEHPGATAKQYFESQTSTTDHLAFTTCLKLFGKLRRLVYLKAENRGSDYYHTVAITEADFYDQCLRVILEQTFADAIEKFQASIERIAKARPRGKLKRKG